MPDRGALSVEEAARWLSVSKRHLYRLMDRGEIRYVQSGGRRLIARTELERYLDPEPAA